jgi:hypothetical protein
VPQTITDKTYDLLITSSSIDGCVKRERRRYCPLLNILWLLDFRGEWEAKGPNGRPSGRQLDSIMREVHADKTLDRKRIGRGLFLAANPPERPPRGGRQTLTEAMGGDE